MDKRSSWTGRARLQFAPGAEGTRPTFVYTQAPLKVQRSFHHPTAGICQTVLIHTAGGMVGGDRLLSEISLEPEAQVLLTTPAAQKVYRSGDEACPPTEQQVKIDLQTNSILDYFPLETIVFNQAQFRQHTHVNLAPGSYFCGWDLTRFGRTAQGEAFIAGQWRSTLEVWQVQANGDAYPLWIDRQQLLDPQALRQTPFGLNAQSVMGSLLLLGHALSNQEKQLLVEIWQAAGYQAPHFSCSRTQQGMVARYRGDSSQQARQGFLHLWQTWKTAIVHQPAWMSRLWS